MIPVVAAPARPTSPEATHFEQLGGAEVVGAVVDSFYRHMDSLPEARSIRAMHAADLAPIRDVLRRYLSEWLGGPPLYSQERGHPRLRMRHQHFPIGPAERDAWMLCMRSALEEQVSDTVLRELLLVKFQKLADWMRNRPGGAVGG